MHGIVLRTVQTWCSANGRPARRPDVAVRDTIVMASLGENGLVDQLAGLVDRRRRPA